MKGEEGIAKPGVAAGSGGATDAVGEQTHRGPGVAGPRSILSAGATKARSALMAEHSRRARTLRDVERLSDADIGERLAEEDGRAEPYDDRQVRRWLSGK